MVILTEENIVWLNALLTQAKDKALSNKAFDKAEKIKELADKINKLTDLKVNISITSEDIEHTNELISILEKLTEEYSNNNDLTDINRYDYIKKQMTANLQSLSTYKDLFLNESSYLEDYLKKELRVRLIQDIMENDKDINNKSISFTHADKLVEVDVRYTSIKNKIRQISDLSSIIKTKYDIFSKIWQMVFQSISTAAKETYMTKNNND